MSQTRKLNIVSWNVRGLGDDDKCVDVRDVFSSCHPTIVFIQESKLNAIPPSKFKSFLPANLSGHCFLPADGTRGGIVTAWNEAQLTLVSSHVSTYSLTCVLSYAAADIQLTLTNVYGPSDHSYTSAFLDELRDLAPLVSGAWLLAGDFNLIRDPSEKNNDNFDASRANAFNLAIHDMTLLELPLLDRSFTWSNQREYPVLARLDRAFLNSELDAIAPNTTLTSLSHATSDHTPLLITIDTSIPTTRCFRFENAWLHDPSFLPMLRSVWHAGSALAGGGAVGELAARLKDTRRAAKVWSKNKHTPFLINNCKFIIKLLDLLEEYRFLHAGEAMLRALCKEKLSLLLRARASYWKQRGKVRVIRDADENTKFHHAHASHRLRQNQIKALEVDGARYTRHSDKARILDDHFTRLLGASVEPLWDFDVAEMYNGLAVVDPVPLTEPFTSSEALSAVKAMNQTSAPGPDGFGPSFYKSSWEFVEPAVMNYLASLHAGTADLERINRAYIVLIPKTSDANTPGAFRPISLQGCPIKIAGKILTSRLQRQIASLVHVDQTGFIKGRSISENFVYATELVQCCHKRKAPAVVLKLDFAKAFDSVSWGSLLSVLHARGFPPKWCDWIQQLQETAKSAVLLNGVPGRWIPCKKGLRQGDPLSPYLFILVADVLQQMLTRDTVLRHPLAPDRPCTVLQYADDTLIVARADGEAMLRLKGLLDSFSRATGLSINYSKSTLVPMHIPDSDVESYVNILGCTQGSFPQTYLGLPLSNEKLKLNAFAPIISSADRYLSGWWASLLNHHGRLILVNAVLDSLPVYAMGALQLPPGVIDALDARRRAFLWAGEETVSGAQCLVSWDRACLPKKSGGLGVRDLRLQNTCLLLKLLHRAHEEGSSAWARWLEMEFGGLLEAPDTTEEGTHLASLRRLLPDYRLLTSVEVGDGRSTSFWHDCWTALGPLAESYPALYSHARRGEASVHRVLSSPLRLAFVSRLSSVASAELATLTDLLGDVVLTDDTDARRCPWEDAASKLSSSALYKTVTASEVECVYYKFIWENCAPPKVKFFGWLLVQNRIQTKENLLKKHCLDNDTCEVCVTGAVESAAHLIAGCPFSSGFWRHLDIVIAEDDVANLWSVQPPAQLPAAHFNTFLLLCCWRLWKHRHDVAFRSLSPCYNRLFARCREDAELWACRLPHRDKNVALAWASMFSSPPPAVTTSVTNM